MLLFLAIALVLIAALAGLGWRFLDQDQAIERQRTQDRLEQAADLVAAELGRRSAETRELLTRLSTTKGAETSAALARASRELGPDALLILLGSDSIESFPPGRLLFYPQASPPAEAPASAFAPGEGLEFRTHDLSGAAASFRALAASSNPAVRAGALVRLARVERKAGQFEAALRSYDRLAALGPVPVGGSVAGLVGLHARLGMLKEAGRATDAERAAAALAEALWSGAWRISRATYRYYAGEVAGYPAVLPDSTGLLRLTRREALANAVTQFWGVWTSGEEEQRAEGSEVTTWRAHPVLVLWRGTSSRAAALMAGPEEVQQGWLAELSPVLARDGISYMLADASGRGLIGNLPSLTGPVVTRTAAQTRLPWTLQVASGDRGADLARYSMRRRQMALAVTALVLLVGLGLYAAVRGVSRELNAARLQSEFVAAVSHEFRTPLTALRQLTEMLAAGRTTAEEQRQRYYRVMQRETGRLQRLVEGLLDFGRMEAGALEFHLVPLAIGDLVREVTRDFETSLGEEGFRVVLTDALPDGTRVSADAEALGRALWNLLDNAAKYSPDSRTVWVNLRQEENDVLIAVRDRGIGVPAAEQAVIFTKFVRGASSGQVGAKGTGIGLAMVRHIMAEHRGTVTIESELGSGTTFTLRLPVEEAS